MRHVRVRRGVLIAAVAISFTVPPAFGQTGLGDDIGARQQRERPMPSERRRERQQQYVQGEVAFEDGTPAPPNVVIERLCGSGNGIPETYTDSKGRFSFQLGRLKGFNPDATQGFASGTPGQSGEELTSLSALDRDFGNRPGERPMAGCSLRAVLPGFRSTTVELVARSRFDNPDVGTIVLKPLEGVKGLGLSLVSLRAPEEARKSFEKGVEDFEKREWGGARKHLEKAIEAYPEHAEAWFALGRVHESEKRADRAREAFETAAGLDPRYVPPLIGLARLDAGETKWDAVVERTERILAMNPNDFAEAYFYDAVANFNRNRHPAAERSAREAITRGAETRFPMVVHVLALSLGYQSKLEEAVVYLRRYLEIAPDSDGAKVARNQLEGIESYLAQQKAAAAEPMVTPQQ